jgi:hypothetical protein
LLVTPRKRPKREMEGGPPKTAYGFDCINLKSIVWSVESVCFHFGGSFRARF